MTPATLLALAPQARRQEIRHQQTTQARPPGDGSEHRRLAVRLAHENPLWGYRRIHGELTKLGVAVARSTVYEILRAAGTDPGTHGACRGRGAGPSWRAPRSGDGRGHPVQAALHLLL